MGAGSMGPLVDCQFPQMPSRKTWYNDEAVPDCLPLPCEDTTIWRGILRAWARYEQRTRDEVCHRDLSADERGVAMTEMIGAYCRNIKPRHGFPCVAGMHKVYPETRGSFLLQTLPFIIEQAKALPARLSED